MAGRARLDFKREMLIRKQRMGQELGEEINEKMKSAMSEFKRSLEEFALKHREEIRHDPEFRAHFHDMCQHAGVDPLASNKSSVNSFLSFSGWSFTTFYYELGVSVVEVCMSTRPQNGGLIELKKLTRLVQQRRGSAVDPVSADDVLQVRPCLSCYPALPCPLLLPGTMQRVLTAQASLENPYVAEF
jgi:ESCRT-II complex subunit VPS22